MGTMLGEKLKDLSVAQLMTGGFCGSGSCRQERYGRNPHCRPFKEPVSFRYSRGPQRKRTLSIVSIRSPREIQIARNSSHHTPLLAISRASSRILRVAAVAAQRGRRQAGKRSGLRLMTFRMSLRHGHLHVEAWMMFANDSTHLNESK